MWNKNYIKLLGINLLASFLILSDTAGQNLKNVGELSKKRCSHYHPLYPGIGISGGLTALPTEYPHMAVIGYETEEGIEWKCGGSLISKKFVLTAAHCTNDKGNLPKSVRLGDLDLAKDQDDARPQDFSIVKVVPHPLYHPPAKYHDIALLELDREVIFSRYVRPACLRIENQPNYPLLSATGWGKTGFLAPSSTHLLKVELNHVSNDKCSPFYISRRFKSFLPQGILDDGQICAAGNRRNQDTCQGDSGGPLQTYRYISQVGRPLGSDEMRTYIYDDYWVIVGITSFGRACGISGAPAVYTRVSAYVPWIETIAFQNEI